MQIGRRVVIRSAAAFGVMAGIIGAPAKAAAQMTPWEETGYIGVNYMYQVKDRAFTERLEADVFGETATSTISHASGGGGGFEIGGAYRVWKNLAAGIAVTSFNTKDGANISSSVPHPLFVNRPRIGVLDVTSGDYKEVGIHLQGVWVMPLTEKITVALSGGPSIFNVDQSLIAEVQPVEIGAPFELVNLSATTAAIRRTAVGGNVGADIQYWVNERYGGGIFLRYTAGSVDLPAAGGDQSIDVGGFQSGIGLRVKF